MDFDPPTLEAVLDLELGPNDAGVDTMREYLCELLSLVWDLQEGFGGKRPFGNSSWDYELLVPLAKAGYIEITYDEEYPEEIDTLDFRKGNEIIAAAIRYMCRKPE